MNSLKGQSRKATKTGAEKLGRMHLLISYKKPNNLNGEFEVTDANEKLCRKVALFSFHIYLPKRTTSML